MKILLILCEGPHDVAFLYKIFRLCLDAKDIAAKKVNEFPPPLGPHFMSILKGYDYENAQIFGKPEIPTVVTITLDEEEIYILIYPMGGETKIPNWKKQIEMYQDIASSELSGTRTDISLALFFDADKGVNERLESCYKNFSELIPDIQKLDLGKKISTEIGIFKSIGLYIFSDDAGKGNLEDILVPIMKNGNENIFNEADTYLDTHRDEKRGKKFDRPKSLIGIVGQLQCSGIANNSIIKQTDYITKDKILDQPKCQEILSFFSELIRTF